MLPGDRPRRVAPRSPSGCARPSSRPRPASVAITISIGVERGARRATCSYDALFKLADEALSEAKHAGRNRVIAAGAPNVASAPDVTGTPYVTGEPGEAADAHRPTDAPAAAAVNVTVGAVA